jgi:hypothetical protein
MGELGGDTGCSSGRFGEAERGSELATAQGLALCRERVLAGRGLDCGERSTPAGAANAGSSAGYVWKRLQVPPHHPLLFRPATLAQAGASPTLLAHPERKQ